MKDRRPDDMYGEFLVCDLIADLKAIQRKHGNLQVRLKHNELSNEPKNRTVKPESGKLLHFKRDL